MIRLSMLSSYNFVCLPKSPQMIHTEPICIGGKCQFCQKRMDLPTYMCTTVRNVCIDTKNLVKGSFLAE